MVKQLDSWTVGQGTGKDRESVKQKDFLVMLWGKRRRFLDYARDDPGGGLGTKWQRRPPDYRKITILTNKSFRT